ncbi:hypothetical protein IC229_33220 [Spirosoma sp. BT702]|uniref:Uncharacterized protein n=1 Tax=Spirosoma profusum TaxID=2771354 RepID=A0A927GAU0_9BACT|nr:hypothetical protein [Spirosoma profusum]MBD2705519.1 hypothetical protein [Spirosoma profusum]
MPAGLPLTLPTAYTAAVGRYNTASLEFEKRKDEYNALAAFIRSSPSLLSQTDINQEKQSFERPYQIPVIKRVAINLVDGRICDLDGQEASTDMVVITFTVKGFRIKVPTEMLDQNYIKYVDLLSNLLYNAWHAWYQFMEINSINYLESSKTTSLVAEPNYFTQDGAAYVGTIGMPFYSAVRYVSSRNLLSANGQLLDVMSGAGMVTRYQMGAYGANNSVNQAMFVGGADPYPSNFLTPDAGFQETHYLFPVGAVGIYHWLSPNAANRHVHIQQQDYWWSEKDPMFGYFNASVHFQAKCVEKTIGYSGAAEPTYYDIYEYTIDSSFNKSYTSVAGESPIIKYNLAPPATV